MRTWMIEDDHPTTEETSATEAGTKGQGQEDATQAGMDARPYGEARLGWGDAPAARQGIKTSPQTAAERQAKHRRRLAHDHDNTRGQLNIVVSADTKRKLRALATLWKTTQQKALERLLLEAGKTI